MGGWCDGFKGEGWVDRWAGGFAKVDNGLQKLITDLDMKNGYKGGA